MKIKLTTPHQKKRQTEALNLCRDIFCQHKVDFNLSGILGKSRKAELIFNRALVVFILRQGGYSSIEIGSFMNRDHATVLNLQKYHTRTQARDDRFLYIIRELKTNWTQKRIYREINLHNERIEALKQKLKLYESVINKNS